MNHRSQVSSTINMLFLLLFLLPYTSTLVLSKPIIQGLNSLSLHTSSNNIKSKAQSPEICSAGERTLVVDAEKRLQTLQWNIGSIEAVSTPVQCETTMSMEYSPQWQYAVTEINWHSYASLLAGSSATTGLSYGFGLLTPVLPVCRTDALVCRNALISLYGKLTFIRSHSIGS
jgi:hypothetical protein